MIQARSLKQLFTILAFTLFAGSVSIFAQKEMTIAEVQGDKAKSPVEGQQVKVRGVVTAITRNSIFIQTPDDEVDNNPATSEGLLVFLGQKAEFGGSVGDLVEASGTVQEFIPQSEKYGFTITELGRAEVKVLGSKNPLPAPIVLTVADMPSNNLNALEKFEGMRVKAGSLTVTQATGGSAPDERNKYQTRSDGVFFATLTGVPRPVREPGVDFFIMHGQDLPKTLPSFDTNPEMIRVDTDAQNGAKPIIVTAGATVTNAVGVLSYSYRRYTLLVDASTAPAVAGNKSYVPVSASGPRELTIGAFNIENFFDDEQNSDNVQKEAVLPKDFFQKRLNKASLAIRLVLSMPDVLGVEEVENLKVLKKLAAKINSDAIASGLPDPKYEAYLEEGNDPRGIDSGFLVKSTRVKVLETKQLAKNEELKLEGRSGDKLFDRPPFMIRVQAIDASSTDPLTITAIVNHLKSYGGIDDPKDGLRVQTKRAQEADWLAGFVAERAKADPNERVLVCGDFNAFVVNDGYNDLIGTLIGTPDQNVAVPGKKVETGLIDLAMLKALPQSDRYSYVYDGSAQVLDHVLINKKLGERLIKFGYARVDADYPVAWSDDGTRPERLSDHDAPVAFFSLDPRKAAGPAKPSAIQAATPIQ
jgi:predicted extracellular nuclease